MSQGDETRRILEQRARRYRHVLDADEAAASTTDMVVFERAGAPYGLPIVRLAAIHRLDSITLLPGLSPVIKGLANVAGSLVAVHDIGSFAKEAQPLGAEIWLLVCRGVGDGVALLADDVAGVRPVASAQLKAPPVALESVRDCFLGIGQDDVAYLDLPRLLLHDDFFKA